jgi:hypothetical protein
MLRSCRECKDDHDTMLPTTLKKFRNLKDNLVVCMNKSKNKRPKSTSLIWWVDLVDKKDLGDVFILKPCHDMIVNKVIK